VAENEVVGTLWWSERGSVYSCGRERGGIVTIGTSVMKNKGGGTQVPNNVVGNQCFGRRWWVHLCGRH